MFKNRKQSLAMRQTLLCIKRVFLVILSFQMVMNIHELEKDSPAANLCRVPQFSKPKGKQNRAPIL
jgi:hypothetical protein